MRSRAFGFTLMEVLVVLVVTSLIATLLFQSFGFSLRMRGRAVEFLAEQHDARLQEHWFRTSTRSLTPDQPDANPFTGERRRFSGLSLAPLDGIAGEPAVVTWELERAGGETRLLYRQGDADPWVIASWRGSDGEFRYLGHDGDSYRSWPPQLENLPQLPDAIVLDLEVGQRPAQWLVAIPGRHRPRTDWRALLEEG